MKLYEKIKSSLSSDKIFDARKNFFNLGIVWFSVFILSSAAVFFFTLILISSDFTFDPTYNGVNNLVEIYKVPLSLLALNIPFIAILGAFHKSEQTRLQIQLSDGQNLFANYFKHIEEFVKHVEKFESIEQQFGCDARRLHKKLFPNAAIGDYDISDEIAFQINELIDYSKTIVVGFDGGDYSNYQELDNVLKSNIQLINSKAVPLDYSVFYAAHAHLDESIANSALFVERLAAFANWIGFIVSYYDFIRHIISFNHSKKISSESYKTLNSISIRNYKIYFSLYFKEIDGAYLITSKYYDLSMQDINKEFLFDFLSLINNDSTR